jgi:hypothetical protein
MLNVSQLLERYMRRLLFLFAVLLTSNAAAQDLPASDAPYIFYYSAALNGFVIERADGTDSRIIGQNVMEQPARNLTGPGWSPSDRWLAWSVVHPEPYQYLPGQGYLINIDGQRFNALDEFQCIYSMLWHPTEDILLVGGQIDGSCRSELRGVATYWLIDPNSQALLASASIEDSRYIAPNIYFESPSVYWFENYIQFRATPESITLDGRYYERLYTVTMHYDGQIHVTPITEDEPTPSVEGGELDLPSTGVMGYSEERQFISRFDPLAELPFEPPMNSSSAGSAVAYLWDDSESWLLVGYDLCFAGCAGVPRRVSVYNPSTNTYREISACGVNNVCISWLPERVPINELPSGTAKSVLPAPISYDWEDAWMNQGDDSRLFADGTHELRCSESHPYLSNQVVNLQTGILDYVLSEAEPCTQSDQEPEFPQIIFAFSPDKKLYAITDKTGYTRLHDAVTGERLVTLNFEGMTLSFSDDSRTLYTRGRYASATWDIEAIVTPITMNNLPPAP